MSYNIDNIRIKEIKNFKISLEEYENIDYPETFEIEYYPDGYIKSLNISGEGSGRFWHDYMENILKASTGYLKALMIWEGGDTVEWLIVNDGKTTYEEI